MREKVILTAKDIGVLDVKALSLDDERDFEFGGGTGGVFPDDAAKMRRPDAQALLGVAMTHNGLRFTALENFVSPDGRSRYIAGLSYTLRPGNTQLAEFLAAWLREGNVRLGGDAALVKGKG